MGVAVERMKREVEGVGMTYTFTLLYQEGEEEPTSRW